MLIGRPEAKVEGRRQKVEGQIREQPYGESLPLRGQVTQASARHRSLAESVLLASTFCLLTSAFCLPPIQADIQAPPTANGKGDRQLQKRTPAPPTPIGTTVRLSPGGSTEIVLQANGALGKEIAFLLRTPPAHGEFVGTPRRTARDAMSVTYVHRAADAPGHDTFSFAVQAPGTAVSAAETVNIEIVDAALEAIPAPAGVPDLAARPSELDFGAVEAGRSTGVTLTLENRGTGLANGRLEPPAPWAVEGDASYSLGKGGRQTFRFVFRPQAEGAFAETLSVQSGNGESTSGCVVRLVGTGLPAPARQPSPTPAALAVLATPAPIPVAAASVASTPAEVAPTSVVHAAPEIADPGSPVTNEASVAAVKVLAVGPSTVELAWKSPVPLPRSYRIERRSFAYDEREKGNVRIDWLPYERTDFHVRADEVRATLRGLSVGEPVTVRVVSVDAKWAAFAAVAAHYRDNRSGFDLVASDALEVAVRTAGDLCRASRAQTLADPATPPGTRRTADRGGGAAGLLPEVGAHTLFREDRRTGYDVAEMGQAVFRQRSCRTFWHLVGTCLRRVPNVSGCGCQIGRTPSRKSWDASETRPYQV